MELFENEIAIEVEGYEEYFITTFGRVWSVKSARWMKITKLKKYIQIGLYKNGKVTQCYIHRLIAIAFIPNPDGKLCVDHIDEDKQNNNIDNLRWVSNQENSFNTKIRCTNTSGVKGVCFKKNHQKWEALITINGKQTHLGYFNTIEEATYARRTKALEVQGVYMNSCETLSVGNNSMA